MSLELQMAVIAALLSVPLTYALNLRTKANRGRAVHVPRIGGLSIVFAFVFAPVVLALFSHEARVTMEDDWWRFLALILCGGAVCLMGAFDDFRDLDWKLKFGVQFAASIALYAFGYRVGELTFPTGSTISLGLLDPVVTVAWLVFVTNALNLIDGRDGVASGVSMLASATMAFVAWDLGHNLIALLFAALAGASLGFVPFNLPRARRLLGDSGAYFLGFSIAGLSIAGFVDTTGRVPLYIPLVALGLPVLDAGLAFLRRFLDARHPFEADQDHLHDRVEKMFTLRPLQLCVASYVITAVFCGAAVLLHYWYKNVGSAVVGAVVLAFAISILVVLGYVDTMWNSVRVLSWRGRPPTPGPEAR